MNLSSISWVTMRDGEQMSSLISVITAVGYSVEKTA